jgi:16S rRNA (cytidine1402-2'-O)-methyltransferase
VSTPGRLVLVGTPLGNREDLSPRARRTILEADVLLCEDTRSPRRLLGEGVELPRRTSCFSANEFDRVDALIAELAEGHTVVFVSEAGMPVWSDPGRRLVEAAIEAGYGVDVIPGPTAAATALCHSGLPAEGATFFGFVARDGAARREALAKIAAREGAAILYEAGNRVPALLSDLAAACADADTRTVVVCRELTKLHQEIQRGTLRELGARTKDALRGEVTIVLEGAAAGAEGDAIDPRIEAARATLDAMLDAGLKPRERAKKLAELTGMDARELYDRLRGRD